MAGEGVKTAYYSCLLMLAAVFPAVGQSGYSGSRTCAACHINIYERQQSSNHARSLRPPREIDELARQLPFQYQDRPSQARLTLRMGAESQLQLEANKEP